MAKRGGEPLGSNPAAVECAGVTFADARRIARGRLLAAMSSPERR